MHFSLLYCKLWVLTKRVYRIVLGLWRLWLNTVTRSSLSQKGFISLTVLYNSLSLKAVMERTQAGQESERGSWCWQGPWKSAASWFAPSFCSTCFIIEPSTEMVLPRMNWALPHQSLIKTKPLQDCQSSNLMEAFSALRLHPLWWL